MSARLAAAQRVAAVLCATLLLRRLDGGRAWVLLCARALYFAHVLFVAGLRGLALRRIVRADDGRRAPTPPSPAARSMTVREHDLRALWARARAWMLSALVVCAVHARARALAPLVVAAVLGALAAWDCPLTRAHVRGAPAPPRPWGGPASPLAALLAPPAQKTPVQAARGAPGRVVRGKEEGKVE